MATAIVIPSMIITLQITKKGKMEEHTNDSGINSESHVFFCFETTKNYPNC